MSSPAPTARSYSQQLRPLFGGRLTPIAVLVVTSVLAGLSEAAILALVAQAGAALVDAQSHVSATLGPLHVSATVGTVLAAGLALAVCRLALQLPLSVVPARVCADVLADMQRQLFHAFTRASWAERSRAREGHVQELVMNQVLQASWAALAATSLVTSALTLLVLVASALLLNVVAALGVLVTVFMMFGLLRPLNELITRRSRALSQAQMDMASGVGQAARLAEETHVFGVAAAQREHMDGYVTTVRGLFYRTQMLSRLTPGIYQSIIYLLVVGGLAVLYATHSGHVASLGAVVLLLIRAARMVRRCRADTRPSDKLYRSLSVCRRWSDATRQVFPPPANARWRTSARWRSKAWTSRTRRGGRSWLARLSFEVTAGETIGVIGPSGAGKSTLVQILLQLRSPDGGSYLVNGTPAAEFAREDWCARSPMSRRNRAFSTRPSRRTSGSIATLTMRPWRRLPRLARIDADIRTWASGYDTIIGPRADAVSGGQQQRICIARALAGRPEVLILDEPTSALDPRSESLLQESLLALKQRLTLFIVAHRMSTLDICNRVMVVVDGRVEDFDTPARLDRRSPTTARPRPSPLAAARCRRRRQPRESPGCSRLATRAMRCRASPAAGNRDEGAHVDGVRRGRDPGRSPSAGGEDRGSVARCRGRRPYDRLPTNSATRALI